MDGSSSLFFYIEGTEIMNKQEIYRFTKEWVYEAGVILRESVTMDLEVEYKTSAADLVTEKDKEIEMFFVKKINATFPNHYILGEEDTASDQKDYNPQNEVVWLVDPIDGTTNFVHQKRNFCISVGVYDNGKPVVGVIYDPISDEMFHALAGEGVYLNDQRMKLPSKVTTYEQALISMNHLWLAPNDFLCEQPIQQMATDIRGFRYIGSAALELAYVSVGRLDGAIFAGLGSWDFGAGYILLQEQGLSVTTLAGDGIDFFKPSSLLTSSKELHQVVQSNYIRLK
ncbi:inositol monophosphatase family protein [Salipaludibacillus neizhouensis]|nr:inositol monophosphatase [Salipaludibacillus neizhouensis]